jgi:hypothetical protein
MGKSLDREFPMKTNNTASATTRCQHCRKRFRIDPNPAFLPCPPTDYEGRLKRCPACLKLFTIELEDAGAVSPARPNVAGWITNPNWVDDIYAGTRRRKTVERNTPDPVVLRGKEPSGRSSQDNRSRDSARQPQRATTHGPDLSFKAYVSESDSGIDQMKRFVGLPPLVTGALKLAALAGCIMFSPIDYPMWRAVKQGKMNPWDRVAVHLGLLYLLHRWSKASRKRREMKEQAQYIAEAIKSKCT